MTRHRAAALRGLALALAVLGAPIAAASPAYADAGIITSYAIPPVFNNPNTLQFAGPIGLTRGPDGNLWFTEQGFGHVDKITPDGSTVTEYVLPDGFSARPTEITAGPDGALWFAENKTENGAIGRITTDGTITEHPVPSAYGRPWSITAGRDGMIWFSEDTNKIGRLDPATGAFKEFNIPTSQAEVSDMTVGPDGNVWFTELGGQNVARITKGGQIREFPLRGGPWGITTGPDGNLWIVLQGANQIAKMDVKGRTTRFDIPTSDSNSIGIAAGADGNLWFTEAVAKKVGRITTKGVITEFDVPDPHFGTFGGGPIAIVPDATRPLMWFTEGRGRISTITVA